MKRTYTKKPTFGFIESTQDYRLPGFNFLYDAPESAGDLYKQLYDNVPVLESAVNTYANLINGDYDIKTASPELTDQVYDILNAIKFDQMLDAAITDTLVYGYSGTEIVLSNMLDMIEKFVDIPHNELRIKRDPEGTIVQFLQLNTLYSRGSNAQANLLNSKYIFWLTRKATTDMPYGRSIFKSLPFLTKIMLEMQDSIGKIYKKYGSPRFHVKYTPTTQLDQTTLTSRLNTLRDAFNKIEVGKDFFSAGDVEVSVVGAGGKEIKFNVEMSEIMQGVFSGIGLPAGVLGYNYGSTETHLATQVQVLVGSIKKYQKYFANAINQFLMPMIAKVYNLPEVPYCAFHDPIIVDESAEVDVTTKEINNVSKLIEMGMIDTTDGQVMLDLPIKTITKPVVEQSTQIKNGGNINV